MDLTSAATAGTGAPIIGPDVIKVENNGEPQTIEIESDILSITPLGSGQEVGRSCHVIEFKGKKIMLDCGIHPGLNGMDCLPFIDSIEADEIDVLLISHFHLDHAGALPWFLMKTTFKGRCFMTHATKAIYRWMLADYIKVSNISSDQMLFNEADLEASMDRIEVINFHEEKEVLGIRFWCYIAGHVLGAAMFMIEIAGIKILYTGDFSRQEDRHLMSAEIPAMKPDVLIIEATYGTHIHEKREDREARFTGVIYDTVTRGGRCLIPVFALGRAQELLLILDEYWSLHPELHDIPIYYASSLAKKCMAVYQTYIHAMNDTIRRQIAVNNPFVFKHISNLKSIDHFDDVGPCVIMASPGMLQSGLSRELFETWCTDSKNTCIIAGYCVEGTLAKQILAEPEEIMTLAGQKISRKCQIEYISFSAHTDFQQTSEFISALRPPNIVLVHGEANEMNRLKQALIRQYEDEENPPVIHNPKNTQSVELHFRGEKTAKVMGSLAIDSAKPGHKLSGVLVKRNFTYHLLDPSDLSKYTNLVMSTISQRLSVNFNGTFQDLTTILSGYDWEIIESKGGSKALRLFNTITLTISPSNSMVILDWSASPVNDMYADAIIAVLMKKRGPELNEKQRVDATVFLEALKDMFGTEEMQFRNESDTYLFSVEGKEVEVDLSKKSIINCQDETVHSMIQKLLNCPSATFH